MHQSLILTVVFLLLSQNAFSLGENSGAGGRYIEELFRSLSPEDAFSHPAFNKNIPSIKMPGTNSYFKATSLCLKGSKIKTKKIMSEACVKWVYTDKTSQEEVETEDRSLATRKKARCISYEASILSHPIDYSVEEVLEGVQDGDGNIHNTEPLSRETVMVKRRVSKSISKTMSVEFYNPEIATTPESRRSDAYLGLHKYDLEKCEPSTGI